MKDIPPDRWRFPREPKHYERLSFFAEAVFWTSLVVGGGRAVLAVLSLIFTLVDLGRYGTPPGTDAVHQVGEIVGKGGIELFQAVALLAGGLVGAGILAMLVEVARNVRRQRMMTEIACGMKPADPPGGPG